MKVEVHTDRNTEQALRFLLDGERLAVMPSIIENSSLAVYETAYYGIPFIASDRGGTPELVHAKHREQVLTQPHPVPLAAKLEEALDKGGLIARPSFSNKQNLATWRRFHAALGGSLADRKSESTRETSADATSSISVCLAVDDNHEYIDEVLEAIEGADGGPDVEVVLADNGSRRGATKRWLDRRAATHDATVRVEHLEAWGEQHAENAAARKAGGDVLVFVRGGAFPGANYFATLARAARSDAAEVFCCFYEETTRRQRAEGEAGTPQAFFADDLNYGFFDTENTSPVIAVRRAAFERLGGFREDFKVPGAHAEFVAQANLAGARVTTIPENLAQDVVDYPLSRRLNYKALTYRTMRPYIEHAPHCYSRIQLRARSGGGAGASRTPGQAGRKGGATPEGLDARARELAGDLAGNARLRAIGWRVYNLQHRLFARLLSAEIAVMKAGMRALRRLRRH